MSVQAYRCVLCSHTARDSIVVHVVTGAPGETAQLAQSAQPDGNLACSMPQPPMRPLPQACNCPARRSPESSRTHAGQFSALLVAQGIRHHLQLHWTPTAPHSSSTWTWPPHPTHESSVNSQQSTQRNGGGPRHRPHYSPKQRHCHAGTFWCCGAKHSGVGVITPAAAAVPAVLATPAIPANVNELIAQAGGGHRAASR